MKLRHNLDYLCWDNIEQVLLRSVRNTGDEETTIDHALRAELTFSEKAVSAGGYLSGDVAWMIPGALVPDGWSLKPGDQLTPHLDQVEYTVMSATGIVRDRTTYQFWRLTSRALSIAHDLTNLITIERNNPTYDAAASKVPAWSAVHTNLKGRVQEVTASPADERGKRVTRRQYQIYLSRSIEVTTDDRVKDRDGNYYAIDSYQNPESITDLMTLSCTRIAG